jgi:hypothetical protein
MLGVRPGCGHAARNKHGGQWDGRDESKHCMELQLRRKELKEN